MCLSFFGILLLSLLYKVLLIIMQLCKFLSLFKIKPTTETHHQLRKTTCICPYASNLLHLNSKFQKRITNDPWFLGSSPN